MKQLISCANHYMQDRDWKMASGLKLCLCSLGVLLGLRVPGKHKKIATSIACGIFGATYIPLMTDFLIYALRFFCAKEDG